MFRLDLHVLLCYLSLSSLLVRLSLSCSVNIILLSSKSDGVPFGSQNFFFSNCLYWKYFDNLSLFLIIV